MAFAPLFNLRNRLLSSAKFRRVAEKIPFGQWFARSHANRLFRIASGFIHSQVLLACVRLSLFDRLRKRAMSVSDLASATGIDERGLAQLLSAAAALRLLERRPGNRFGLGPLGASMNENGSVEAFVLHHAALYEDLEDPVSLFDGRGETRLKSLWTYAGSDLPAGLDEAEVEPYTRLMSQSQSMVADQVLGAFSLKDATSLIDIGGGEGEFAIAVSQRYPDLAVTVADLPPVAELARKRLATAGLERRIDVIGIDATVGDIPGSYDVASLVRILHDHDDETAAKILASARTALNAGSRLVVAEPLAGSDRAGALNDAYFSVYLHAMGSGRPRRYEELKLLLEAAGFDDVQRHRTRVPLITSVISARCPEADL